MTVTVNGVTTGNLTTATDFAKVTGTGVDTVFGEVSTTPANNTLTTGDVIQGNGKTILNAVLGNPAASPVFSLTAVNAVDLVSIAAGTTVLDATKWKDVHFVKLGGFQDGNVATLNNLDTTGSLKLKATADFNNTLKANGFIGDFAYAVNLSNYHAGSDGISPVFRFKDGNINVRAGSGDYMTATVSKAVVDASTDIDAGDMTVGNIKYVVGDTPGDASLLLYHTASVSAGDGDASVGDTVMGDLTLEVGKSGGPSFYLSASATQLAGKGNATVGNMTVGDINITMHKEADIATIYFVQYANANTGDATIGDLTVGNITVKAEASVSYPDYWGITQSATVSKTGTATVGTITIGDISIDMADKAGSNDSFDILNFARAGLGDAKVGDLVIGDIHAVAVDYTASSASLDWSITAKATAATSAAATKGDATVGDLTIGNISVVGGTNFNVESIDVRHEAYVEYGNGVATVGDTTIGDIELVTGRSGSLEFTISVTAKQSVTTKQFYGGSHVGKVTVGDVALKGGFAADIEYSANVLAEHGRVDGYVVGDVNVTTGDSGAISILQSITGASIGAVKFGDLHIDMGYNGNLTYYYVKASATGTAAKTGNISSFTVGDIDVKVADKGAATSGTFSAIAAHNIGAVDVGNVALQMTGYGTNDWVLKFSAANKVHGVTVGDVKLTGLEGANNTNSLTIDIDGKYGAGVRDGIHVGDVTQIMRGSAEGTFHLDVDSSKGNVGDITVGDVMLKGIGGVASASATFYMHGTNTAGQTGGSMTIGDVSMISRGHNQTNVFTAQVTGLDSAGDINIGNIRMIAEYTGTTANSITNDFDVYLKTDGDSDVNIGDVVVRAIDSGTDLTKSQYIYGSITISNTQGVHDVNIGDVKVVGGFENTTGAIADDFDVMSSLFTITTTGKITFGDVDYSKYVNDATIGESTFAWHGMGTIKAAQGDTTIYDTDEQNTIILGAGSDTVYFDDGQTFGFDDATKIDTMVNFEHAKDTLDLTDITGTTFKRAGSFATYEDFVTAAKASVAADTDVYVAIVGSDTFIGVDADDDKVMDWSMKVAGVTNLDFGDFTI